MKCTGRLHAYIRPVCGSIRSRAIMESARSEPFVPVAIMWDMQDIGLVLRRSDQYHHEHDHFIAPFGWVSSLNQAAATSAGALNSKSRSRYQLAQTIRASLLATATAALLFPVRARVLSAQSRSASSGRPARSAARAE
jgi:hypothetical protein